MNVCNLLVGHSYPASTILDKPHSLYSPAFFMCCPFHIDHCFLLHPPSALQSSAVNTFKVLEARSVLTGSSYYLLQTYLICDSFQTAKAYSSKFLRLGCPSGVTSDLVIYQEFLSHKATSLCVLREYREGMQALLHAFYKCTNSMCEGYVCNHLICFSYNEAPPFYILHPWPLITTDI